MEVIMICESGNMINAGCSTDCTADGNSVGGISVSSIKVRLAGIDWSFVAKKLALLGYKSAVIVEMIADYHKYLILVGAVGNQIKLVPWRQLDKAWHEHILHTVKYKEDCNRLFGYFLDHNPEIKKDSKEHKKNSKATSEAYKRIFNETMPK